MQDRDHVPPPVADFSLPSDSSSQGKAEEHCWALPCSFPAPCPAAAPSTRGME